MSALASPALRAEGSARLARALGAEAMFAFVFDVEAASLVPAPGFPQTLPGGPSWDAFLLRCREPGWHRGPVAYPDEHTLVEATAFIVDGVVLGFIGEGFYGTDPEAVGLPVIAALLRAEHALGAAEAKVGAAQAAARQAQILARALEQARSELDRALRSKQEALLRARESEARKKAVVQSALDAVISIDGQGRVLEFNPAAEAVFGLRAEEALGRELGELIDAGETPVVGPESTLLGKRIEASGRRPDGARFPVELAIARIELEGAPIFTAFVRDITARVKAEEERERILGIVGHDLRNPLQAVMMAGALLARRDLPEAQQRVVRRIQSSSERMGRIISELLDFARTRNGTLPLERKPSTLRQVISQVVEELETGHPGRRIVFTTDSAGEGEWDVGRMSQLASNLIGNAIQHSPEDSPVVVALTGDRDTVALNIGNRNRGAPISDPVGIFEPFRRGDQSTGLGLGLYIVQQIARAHGGAVTVFSTEDGTVFRVELPRGEERLVCADADA
jgi:PAS domain S-box-containing protein